jgi:transposase
MSGIFWLSDAQMARLEPCFPKSQGKPRVDGRRVLSGIIFISRNGLRWRDAPREYGPQKTLYNHWKRWSDRGGFARIMAGLATEHGEETTVMIEVSRRTPCIRVSLRKYLKAHRRASSLGVKRGAWTPDPLPGKALRSNVP